MAIDRLRAYVPPPTSYGDVPLTRRAAVLLLLYADRKGDLRVVLTIRAKTLSSCMSLPLPSSPSRQDGWNRKDGVGANRTRGIVRCRTGGFTRG